MTDRIKLEDCEDDIIDIIKRFGGTRYTHYVYLNDKKISEEKIDTIIEILKNLLF